MLRCLSLVIFVVLPWFGVPALAADRLAGPVPGVVDRVIDGDTLVVRAKIWLNMEVSVRVRLADVDAPELSRPGCARERKLAEQAKTLVEAAIGPGAVRLYDVHYGKYAGRVVARVEVADAKDLSSLLKAKGFDGADWCTDKGSASD